MNDVPTGGMSFWVVGIAVVILVLWQLLRGWLSRNSGIDLEAEHAKSGCPVLMLAAGMLLGVMFGRSDFMTAVFAVLLIWGLTGISKVKG
ncbi:hypothetical protein [Prosthecobacter sp.]|uniref:hypothetical protein n=1 Tax=Prosthecobacter sp. TaxID=1965333 RepID=UPI0025E0D368|nr:hypothetical protein [Prosthecobacter sp.]